MKVVFPKGPLAAFQQDVLCSRLVHLLLLTDSSITVGCFFPSIRGVRISDLSDPFRKASVAKGNNHPRAVWLHFSKHTVAPQWRGRRTERKLVVSECCELGVSECFCNWPGGLGLPANLALGLTPSSLRAPFGML